MLVHFQEEEAFGRAHVVRGDEIITTIPNTITSVALRIPGFFSFFLFSLVMGASMVGVTLHLNFLL